jgi:transcription elongation factor Elf1
LEKVLTNLPFCGTILIQRRKEIKTMRYVKYFYCPYCNKELLNQNEFIDCDNENEFWCDDCDNTYIIDEDGEVIEE